MKAKEIFDKHIKAEKYDFMFTDAEESLILEMLTEMKQSKSISEGYIFTYFITNIYKG